MISALLTLFAVGLVTLLVVGVLLAVAGTVFSIGFGLASFLPRSHYWGMWCSA